MKKKITQSLELLFVNCACQCFIDVDHSKKIPKKSYHIFPENEKKVFSFDSKKGLVQIDEEGKIISENIIGKMVALVDGVPRGKKDPIERFFEEYGFILALTQDPVDRSNLFPMEVIHRIIKRLRSVLKLMIAVSNNSKDYKEISNLVMDILLRNDVAASFYQSCVHSYWRLEENASEASGEAELIDFSGYQYSEEERMKNKSFWVINEYIQDNTEIRYTQYEDEMGETILQSKAEDEFRAEWFEKNYSMEIEIHRLLSLYWQGRKGRISKTTLEEIARYLIQEEIMWHISKIKIDYAGNTMTCQLTAPSLLVAAYFELSQFNPDKETYATCQDKKCNKYFLIQKGGKEKLFCSTRCQNRSTQQNYRDNQKKNANKAR